MKKSSLKTKYAVSIVFFFMLYGTTSVQMFAAHGTEHMQTIEQSISVLLEQCFDMSNNQPFSYFIDQLVILIEGNPGALRGVIKDPEIKNKDQYIHNFLRQVKKIRNWTEAKKIGQSLQEYKVFMPEWLRNKGSRELLKVLEHRLSC